MKKYIWLIVLLMLIFIPKVVKAEVIEITQEDLANACLSGQTVKGISCSGSSFYIESGEYKLGSDFTSDNTIWIYIDDSNVKLDLNNKIVTNGYIRVQNSGTLEVSGEGTITNDGDIFNVFDNDSSLIINSGTFISNVSSCVDANSDGNLIINGGYFESMQYPLVINNSNEVEINGGTFVGLIGATFQDYNSLVITGGTFNGGIYGIAFMITGEVGETKISGGNFTASKQDKYNLGYNEISNRIYVYNDTSEEFELAGIEDVIGSIAITMPHNNQQIDLSEIDFNFALENGYRLMNSLNLSEAVLLIEFDFYEGEYISGYTQDGEWFDNYYCDQWIDGYYQNGHWEDEEFVGEDWVEGYYVSGSFDYADIPFRVIHATDTDNSVIPIEGEYEIIEGENQTYNDSDLVIKSNGDYSLFQKLLVDEEEVDSSNYTVESGSTIVTLKKEYIDTLDEGSHTVTFVYVNGQVSTNFTINANAPQISNMPETFDNIYTNIIVLITSMIMLIVIKKRFI